MNREQQEIALSGQLYDECAEYIALCDELEAAWCELAGRMELEQLATPIEDWGKITPSADAVRQRAAAVASLRVKFVRKFKAAGELAIEQPGGTA